VFFLEKDPVIIVQEKVGKEEENKWKKRITKKKKKIKNGPLQKGLN